MAEEFRVQGLDALQRRLDEIKSTTAKRMLNRSLRAAGEVFQVAIQERAPERPALPSGTALPPGALKRDIEIHTLKGDEHSSIVTVGPGKLTKHAARWVEFGHRMVRGGYSKVIRSGRNAGQTRGPGKAIGNVPPHPFERPAFEASEHAALDAFANTLNREVAALDKKGRS